MMMDMTEKRFTTKYTNHYVLELDVYDNDERISFYETIDLINELHEENKGLKQELDNIYLLIGRGDWSGLVDLLVDDVKQ